VPADLAESLDVQITPEIRALAQSLATPVAIRNWVYNHVDFDPTWGSIQGSALTLLNRHGNAHDIASLTIALMRAANIPARYVRGVVELPVAQVQNWLGKIATPDLALELMQKGGLPSAGVITGGRIQAIRFEHVWVEAWVDYIPSRGAINRAPDQWAPLDVAFKQYTFLDALPLLAATEAPREQLTASFLNRISVDANRGVSGFDFDFYEAGLADIAQDYADGVEANPPAPEVRLRDDRAIVTTNSDVLEGALPFPLRSANVERFSTLPATARQTATVKFYANDTALRLDNPTQERTFALVELGTKRFALEYVPQSPADAQALALLEQSNASTLPAGQIFVFPKLQIGNTTLIEGAPERMGTPHYWRLDVRDTLGNATATESFRFTAGSNVVFAANLAGTSADRVERETAPMPDTAALPVKDALYFAGLTHWAFTDDLQDYVARSAGGRMLRLPSIGAFAQPLEVRYFFGVPRTGFVAGTVTDIKASRAALVTTTPRSYAAAALKLGGTGSIMEGAAWNILKGTQNAGLGISTSTILRLAIDQGQKIYQVDITNAAAVLAITQLSADAENEILQAVRSGLVAVIPEREVSIRTWSGAGYVIFDPTTGSSLQRIEGGLAGGIEVGCAVKAVVLEILCKMRIIKLLKERLARILLRLGARLAVAIAALVTGPIGVVANIALGILTVLEIAITVIMVVNEVTRWVTGIMNGTEVLTPEELAALGLNSLNDLACDYIPPCLAEFGYLNIIANEFGIPASLLGLGASTPTSGNPVAIGNGAKWQTENHYRGSGPFPLEFTRTYLSRSYQTASRVGAKWAASYTQQITVQPSADGAPFPPDRIPKRILMGRTDGTWAQYNLSGANTYLPGGNIRGFVERIVSNGNTVGWRHHTPTDTTELFTSSGQLLQIEDKSGLTHSLAFDGNGRPVTVTDSYGRQLRFDYNAEGYLATLTDPLQRVTRFSYDEFGNFVESIQPDNQTRQFHYENLNQRFLLTGITDERNVRVSSWTYDSFGRVKTADHGGTLQRRRYAYSRDTVTETDPLGTARTYQYLTYRDLPYLIGVTEPCSSCGSGSTSEQTFDARGFVSSTKDFRGNQTLVLRDARGLITTLTEAAAAPQARTTTFTWHPTFHLPTRVVEPITGGTRVTNLTYDSEGNRLTRSVTANNQTRTWTYTYNANGQVLTEDGPRTDVADVSTYTYSPTGDLATMTDALGHTTRYEAYNADGQLTRMVNPNGLLTEYDYDDRQRLIEAKEGTQVTEYQYDGTGNLTQITLPDASFLRYTYDAANRLTEVRDNLGHRMSYALDGNGNRIKDETFAPNNALAETMQRVYDSLGRLKETLGAESQKTAFTYDGNGNEKSATDPLLQQTRHDYDALDRLTKTIDPNGGEIEFGYDARDNLTRVIDPRDLTTSYAYSGFDELARLTSPDTGITDYTYDAAGNLKTRKDARNVTASYQYDQEDRVTSISYPALNGQVAETLAFTYDETSNGNFGKGQLTSISDGSGTTRFKYDQYGRQIEKAQTVGTGTPKVHTTSYQPNGQIDGHVLPSGAEIRYTYRADGRVLTISVNGQVVVREIEYHPMGPVKSWTYGTGNDRYERQFDRDGRIKEHTASAATRSIAFDAASRITGITDGPTSQNRWTYGYDNLDRLNSAQNAATAGPIANLNLAWTYDPTGNRRSETRNQSPTPYTIDPASNKLSQVGTLQRTYDAVGNTLNNGEGLISQYNARNRLIQTTRSGEVATYAHNAFGERVCKSPTTTACTQATNRIEFVYDDDGHVIGEYPSTGNTSADAQAQIEFLWLADAPIAVLKRKPGSTDGSPTGGGTSTAWQGTSAGGVEVFYLHPDHLDTPRVLVNATNQQVWRWDSLPFGDSYPNEQPTAGLPIFVLNQRFPGQQYDRETGTHYNYFRDYEAGTGRYVQSDPIGLIGGANVFQYSWASPVLFLDREGLGRVPVPSLTVNNRIPDEKLIPPDKRGNAPISCDDGCPIELHHVDQETDLVDEMTQTDHRRGENFAKNHDNTGQDDSKIDRKKFCRQKRKYWAEEWDKGRFEK
jgi:RHS repeat-associated protein